ncbi:hypothetical protein LDENG_00004100 [Lucifuga dentata]|nr:hypothetical protein LDENG_00004100 [Lucifuga dentata]
MIHHEALVAKQIDDELYQALQQDIIHIVNFISHRLFSVLCNKMGASYEGLLLHSTGCQRPILSCVYELREEIAAFLASENLQLGSCLADALWIWKLAYMSDIFQHLNRKSPCGQTN